MNLQKDLTKQLIQYILSIFGLGNNIIYDTIGIYCEKFKTSHNIKFEYEGGGIEKYPIFCASTTIEDSKLQVIGVKINNVDEVSYSVLFKLNNFFTYGIKLIEDNFEEPIFLVSKINGSWSKLSMYDKIIACAGLEKINDFGIIWKPEGIGQYYNTLIELVEM